MRLFQGNHLKVRYMSADRLVKSTLSIIRASRSCSLKIFQYYKD